MISSIISSLYMAMGELYCLVAILGFPTVVNPFAFWPGISPVRSSTFTGFPLLSFVYYRTSKNYAECRASLYCFVTILGISPVAEFIDP
jgi:hypothetical protein